MSDSSAAPEDVIPDSDESSAGPDAAPSSEEGHATTITDEDLHAALGSQEEALAHGDEEEAEVVNDAHDVTEPAEVTLEASSPTDSDVSSPESAFAVADDAFQANQDEAVKAITEIKQLIEENDLTKLTKMVERTRTLIADVESQVHASGGESAADEQPEESELALAAQEESGSLTRCMSELDHELESLLDELAMTPVKVEESSWGTDEAVDFDEMAGHAAASTVQGETLDSDVEASAASESEEIAQLMATLPDPEQVKSVETSPLLPSELGEEHDTSPLALASGEQQSAPVAESLSSGSAAPQATSPIDRYVASDERIRGIIQEQLLDLLETPAVQQKIFAMLALEAAVNPSALSELTGVRAFLKAEIESMMKQHVSDLPL